MSKSAIVELPLQASTLAEQDLRIMPSRGAPTNVITNAPRTWMRAGHRPLPGSPATGDAKALNAVALKFSGRLRDGSVGRSHLDVVPLPAVVTAPHMTAHEPTR
jgi:hypothetical protein